MIVSILSELKQFHRNVGAFSFPKIEAFQLCFQEQRFRLAAMTQLQQYHADGTGKRLHLPIFNFSTYPTLVKLHVSLSKL